MSSLIESLESRTLLSGTGLQASAVAQAVTALGKDASQARIDVTAAVKTEAADVKAIKADLKRLKNVPANAALLKQFSRQEQTASNQFRKDASALAASVSKDTRHSIADAIKFVLSPGNTQVSATLEADLVALQKLTTSGPAEKLVADVSADQTLATNDLTAIATANAGDAQTTTDVNTAKSDLSSNATTLQNDVNTLEADLTTLINAVKAVQMT